MEIRINTEIIRLYDLPRAIEFLHWHVDSSSSIWFDIDPVTASGVRTYVGLPIFGFLNRMNLTRTGYNPIRLANPLIRGRDIAVSYAKTRWRGGRYVFLYGFRTRQAHFIVHPDLPGRGIFCARKHEGPRHCCQVLRHGETVPQTLL